MLANDGYSDRDPSTKTNSASLSRSDSHLMASMILLVQALHWRPLIHAAQQSPVRRPSLCPAAVAASRTSTGARRCME
eukprot:5025433-Amphidinium_carterae.1